MTSTEEPLDNDNYNLQNLKFCNCNLALTYMQSATVMPRTSAALRALDQLTLYSEDTNQTCPRVKSQNSSELRITKLNMDAGFLFAI